MQNICALKVRIGDKIKRFDGRVAWCLHQLLTAGAAGCTTLANPAPRWSDLLLSARAERLSTASAFRPSGLGERPFTNGIAFLIALFDALNLLSRDSGGKMCALSR
jgi:hypothetical protein